MFARPLTATTNTATATAIPSERDVDAHLSEGIPRYWLLDNTSLRSEAFGVGQRAARALVMLV